MNEWQRTGANLELKIRNTHPLYRHIKIEICSQWPAPIVKNNRNIYNNVKKYK